MNLENRPELNQLKSKSINLNSIWRKLEQTGFKFYCVSCHRERHLAVPARVGTPQFYFHVLVATAFLMLVFWPLFHAKGVVLLVPIWGAFEALYRMKFRSMLVCPDCDFDPVLYLVNPDKAVIQVENVWRKKFEERGYPFPERKRQGRVAPAVVPQQPVAEAEATVEVTPGTAELSQNNPLPSQTA